jgi:hypothetical protein
VRRDELDAGGRDSSLLSRVEKLAGLQRHGHRRLLKKRYLRMYRLERDIWHLKTLIVKDRADTTEVGMTEESKSLFGGDSQIAKTRAR